MFSNPILPLVRFSCTIILWLWSWCRNALGMISCWNKTKSFKKKKACTVSIVTWGPNSKSPQQKCLYLPPSWGRCLLILISWHWTQISGHPVFGLRNRRRWAFSPLQFALMLCFQRSELMYQSWLHEMWQAKISGKDNGSMIHHWGGGFHRAHKTRPQNVAT